MPGAPLKGCSGVRPILRRKTGGRQEGDRTEPVGRQELYTIHYTLYTLHYTPNTLHHILHAIHSTLYAIHYTLHTIHYNYTIYYTLHAIHYTLYTTRHTLYAILTILQYTLLLYIYVGVRLPTPQARLAFQCIFLTRIPIRAGACISWRARTCPPFQGQPAPK